MATFGPSTSAFPGLGWFRPKNRQFRTGVIVAAISGLIILVLLISYLSQPQAATVYTAVVSETQARFGLPRDFLFGQTGLGNTRIADFLDGEESQITQIIGRLMHAESERRAIAGQSKPLFVDVGMNMGWFALLAASMGSRVVAFEPQPFCVRLTQASSILNGFDADLSIRNLALTRPTSEGGPRSIRVRTGFCSGYTQIHDNFKPPEAELAQGGADFALVEVPASSLDAEFAELVSGSPGQATSDHPQVITMMKIDTEGAEVGIIAGARKLFQRRLIRNLVIEVMPSVWADYGVGLEEGIGILNELVEVYGFQGMVLFDSRAPGGLPGTAPWKGPMPCPPKCGSYDGSKREIHRLVDFPAWIRGNAKKHWGGNIWFRLQD